LGVGEEEGSFSMVIERIRTLNGELASDPLGRDYASMSDQQAADDLNTTYRSRVVTSVAASVVFEATVASEYDALTAAQKTRYNSMLAMGELDPSGTNTRDVFASLFGGGTTTRANLLALSSESISRSEELEVGMVLPADVTRARAFVP
jgi:hypothetical protein